MEQSLEPKGKNTLQCLQNSVWEMVTLAMTLDTLWGFSEVDFRVAFSW